MHLRRRAFIPIALISSSAESLLPARERSLPTPRQFQGEKHMSDIKKDHSIGAGTGAAAGAVTGATAGSAGGPVGMAAGAVVGGIIGAAAGDSIAEVVNPTTYEDYWKRNFHTTPYYTSGLVWSDYQPAYKLGYSAFAENRSHRFDDIESDLRRNWEATKGNSRLAWHEAKGAVRDGWHYVERALPGDADGDGI